MIAKQMDSLPAHLRSRKQAKQLQHLDILETLIAAFPTKNRSSAANEASALPQLPPASSSPPNAASTIDDGASASADGTNPADEDEQSEDPEALAQMDMATLLERIRARYKVVCASLGIPAKHLEAGGEPRANNDAGANAAGEGEPAATESTSSSANATTAPPRGSAVIGGKVVNTSQLRF